MEERFIDLESRIAHQEYLIDTLNQIIYRQQGKIDRMEEWMTEMARRMTSLDSGISGGHERPPHY